MNFLSHGCTTMALSQCHYSNSYLSDLLIFKGSVIEEKTKMKQKVKGD